ncbi:bifunctional aspartate kinase/homoserine dehydrogenase I [Marinicella sp. W31]|uniref:bifunctional aspartate kinase/homoserine dehydrogenase I n=1 Tax=Marinicella sp. W31 TaxID=3023713 RepID=UPI0037577FDC
MKVFKFGGSSLANVDAITRTIQIITAEQEPLAIVLSAQGGLTDKLHALLHEAQSGGNWQIQFDTFKNIQQDLLTAFAVLDTEEAKRIWLHVNKARHLLLTVEELADCPPIITSWIATLGERIMALLIAAILRLERHKCLLIPADECIVTDGNQMLTETIEQKIKTLDISSARFVIMPGYMAANAEGKITTLGRNGSDYSAALLAQALTADECVIWTDVDGVYTADPRLVPDAELIEHMSYEEALELSWFGAGVLHPKTIAPLMSKKIPCQIRNTLNPQALGTRIDQHVGAKNGVVTAISCIEDVSMLTVTGPGMKGVSGMAARVFSALAACDISIILITQSSSEYSISFCVLTTDQVAAVDVLEQAFELELKNQLLQPIVVQNSKAVVSVISDNMRDRRGVAADFFESLSIAKVNIVAIAQGSNERSISAVIDQHATSRAISSCHQLFFNSLQRVEIILIGCGLIGKAFLQQIQRQQEYLQQHRIQIKVFGIVNTQGILLNPKGIDLSDYETSVATQMQPFDNSVLDAFRKNNNMVNPIIVDCTSSGAIASDYIEYMQAGYHIVAANKKANTADLDYYRRLKTTSSIHNRQFLYETNVGAGLPVIENFRNLLKAGDALIRFEGILSGSMSYIFGLLDDGIPFSQAVAQAREKGFTEPDPRDDLSGEDVARKVLILAREAGMNLELEDIAVDSLLNDAVMACTTVDEVMQQLEQLDATVEARIQQAGKTGAVLRYVGLIDEDGCRVSIEAVSSEHPMYSVKGGENALSFYSQYYQPIPLVLRGYGAGAEVTAAGIFADILKIVPVRYR